MLILFTFLNRLFSGGDVDEDHDHEDDIIFEHEDMYGTPPRTRFMRKVRSRREKELQKFV